MKLNWIESKVAFALSKDVPKGYITNPHALFAIAKGLVRCGGECPCSHEEWDENTSSEDKLCPCITFRNTGDCHCNLYLDNTPTT